MAQHFLDNMPIMVKRNASKEEARGYVQTLHNIGAEVRVERIDEEAKPAPAPPRYQSLSAPSPITTPPVATSAPVVASPPAPAVAPKARPDLNRTMLGMASVAMDESSPAVPVKPPVVTPVEASRQTPAVGNTLFAKAAAPAPAAPAIDAPLFVPGLSPTNGEEADDPFGLQDWGNLSDSPDEASLAPVSFPSDVDIMVGKADPVEEIPAVEEPRGVSQFDPNMQSMLGLGLMEDPGLLGTEEYQAVLDYAKTDGEELLPGENFSFADESLEEDPLDPSSPFGSISSVLAPDSTPSMQAPSLPSNPFGAPLGQDLSLPTEKPPAPSMGVNLEARMLSADEEAPRSLSEITPKVVETRPPMRAAFDPAQAGAGLPTSDGPGMVSQELPALPSAPLPGTGGIKAAPMHHLPPGIKAVPPPNSGQVIPAARRREEEFTIQDNGDGKGFWGAVPVAFIAPVKGKGVLWIPLLGLLQVFAGCASALPCMMIPGLVMICLYLGMMGTYFTSSVSVGMERQAQAPDLIDADMQTIKWEVIAKGAALGVLSVILFALPGLIWTTQVDTLARGPEIAKVRSFDQEEVFYTKAGDAAEIDPGGKARVLFDEEGNEYLVNPLVNRVELLKAAKPTQEPNLQDILPGLALVFLSLMLAMLYWPMALTVHSLSNSLLSLFNPIPVFKGIFRGGFKYLVVAGAPAVISVAGVLFLGLTASLGSMTGDNMGSALATGVCSLLFGTCFYGYITGVQGHMIGRLLADQPEDFEDLA